MHQMDIGHSPKMKMSRLLNRSLFFTPLPTSKMGYRFGKEDKTMDIYKLIRKSNWKAFLFMFYLWEILFMSYFFKYMRHFSEVIVI